jgi:hypothetical protein
MKCARLLYILLVSMTLAGYSFLVSKQREPETETATGTSAGDRRLLWFTELRQKPLGRNSASERRLASDEDFSRGVQ